MSQSPAIRQAMQRLGRAMGPDVLNKVHTLFNDEQLRLAERQPPLVTDVSYGPHERHRLDIYRPAHATQNSKLPVLVFVHGGGFLKGDKGDSHWYNASVGRFAAQQGFIGVVLNYRLAPDFTWPAGGEDVGQCVSWLSAHIAEYGGDAENIILAGTSSGAVHVATYFQLNPHSTEVKGLIFLSGLYGVTPLDERDELYYGESSLYPQRMPLAALINCPLPMFIACSEFDPPRFQQEWLGLMQERFAATQQLDHGMLVAGHNHYSIAGHIGTSDTRLADEMVAFINDCTRR